jgi:lipid A 4'-phosphatase
MVIWRLSIAMVVLALAGLALALAGLRLAGIGARTWSLIALLYLLGPILLVNGILKRFWGRARPADIAEFGGTARFTPPWPPADECARNCSFVSGEGAAAVALMIAALVILAALRPRLTPALHRAGVVLAVALPAIGIGLRIATGRHFLSDTVFAALFMLAIALVLHRVLPDRRRGG